MNPLDDDSYYQLGRLHEQLDGKDQMGKALKKFNEDEWAKSLGKEDDEAAAAWREALKINPAHWGAHHAMSHRLAQSSVKKKRQKAKTSSHLVSGESEANGKIEMMSTTNHDVR